MARQTAKEQLEYLDKQLAELEDSKKSPIEKQKAKVEIANEQAEIGQFLDLIGEDLDNQEKSSNFASTNTNNNGKDTDDRTGDSAVAGRVQGDTQQQGSVSTGNGGNNTNANRRRDDTNEQEKSVVQERRETNSNTEGDGGLSDNVITDEDIDLNNHINNSLSGKGKCNLAAMGRVSAQTFHDAIVAAKQSNPNGWMVDAHEVADYERDQCFLSEDGTFGVAVTPEGDIISVFSATQGTHAIEKLMLWAIAHGGKKLDCYVVNDSISLADLYSRFGFKVAATTPFAEGEWLDPAYPAWKEQNEDKIPKYVAAMYFTGTLEDALNGYVRNSSVDVSTAPVFDGENGHEDMLNYRDVLLNEDTSDSLLPLPSEDKPYWYSWTDEALQPLLDNGTVTIIEYESEIPEGVAREAILADDGTIRGWYSLKEHKSYVYLPNIYNTQTLNAVIAHEAIAHYGLRQLMGEKEYNAFCERIFKTNMRAAEQDAMIRYVYETASVDRVRSVLGDKGVRTIPIAWGENGEVYDSDSELIPYSQLTAEQKEQLRQDAWFQQAAADEYIAKLAESMVKETATEQEQSAWSKVVNAIRDFLRNIGINIKVSDKEIADALRRSYLNLRNGGTQQTEGEGEDGLLFSRNYNAEERQILAAAPRDEQGRLLAPNDKPSKLDERQYVQVRTQAFKKWFGDWELAEQAKWLFNSKAVRSLTGDEFKADGVKLTDKVPAYYQEQYGGKVTRQGIGDVVLDKQSVKDSISHGIGKVKSAAFAAVPEIIRDGIIIDQQNDWKERGYGSVSIAAPIEIAGERYIGVAIIKQLQNETNRFYLHEVVLQKSLQDESIKTDTKADFHRGDVAKVLQKFETSKSASENVSKIVDENGEPRVMYHHTDGKSSWFTFDISQSRAASDIQGVYFAPENDPYNEYGERILECYLNLKNPADYKTAYEGFAERKTQLQTAGVEQREALQAQGYDGVVVEEDGELVEIIAFTPSQIKSATDNNGEFSTGNDDIRFSRVSEQENSLEQEMDAYEERFSNDTGDSVDDLDLEAEMAALVNLVNNGISLNHGRN